MIFRNSLLHLIAGRESKMILLLLDALATKETCCLNENYSPGAVLYEIIGISLLLRGGQLSP